jgi:hypothetical protein
METTFTFGPAMIAGLVAIIVAAGSVVALVFRRMNIRNEKREQQHQQQAGS